MFSPSFECSLAGLHSAVRLRAVVSGETDPETYADRYMESFSTNRRSTRGAGALRDRLELVIDDIERLTSSIPTS